MSSGDEEWVPISADEGLGDHETLGRQPPRKRAKKASDAKQAPRREVLQTLDPKKPPQADVLCWSLQGWSDDKRARHAEQHVEHWRHRALLVPTLGDELCAIARRAYPSRVPRLLEQALATALLFAPQLAEAPLREIVLRAVAPAALRGATSTATPIPYNPADAPFRGLSLIFEALHGRPQPARRLGAPGDGGGAAGEGPVGGGAPAGMSTPATGAPGGMGVNMGSDAGAAVLAAPAAAAARPAAGKRKPGPKPLPPPKPIASGDTFRGRQRFAGGAAAWAGRGAAGHTSAAYANNPGGIYGPPSGRDARGQRPPGDASGSRGSNAGPRANSSSSFRGVTAVKNRSTGELSGWQAQITVRGQNQYLGKFDTQQQAALAYDRAALMHYGAGCVLNFDKKTAAAMMAQPGMSGGAIVGARIKSAVARAAEAEAKAATEANAERAKAALDVLPPLSSMVVCSCEWQWAWTGCARPRPPPVQDP
eukprot:g5658.t1